MLNLFKNKEKLNNDPCETEVVDKINTSDVEYFVFENKGVVVCKLHNCRFIALHRIDKYTHKTIEYLEAPYKYLIDEVYTGVAKCSPEDKFDEEYGKKLALTKAKAARGKAVNNAIKTFMSDIEKDLNNLKTYGLHEVPDVNAFVNEE